MRSSLILIILFTFTGFYIIFPFSLVICSIIIIVFSYYFFLYYLLLISYHIPIDHRIYPYCCNKVFLFIVFLLPFPCLISCFQSPLYLSPLLQSNSPRYEFLYNLFLLLRHSPNHLCNGFHSRIRIFLISFKINYTLPIFHVINPITFIFVTITINAFPYNL